MSTSNNRKEEWCALFLCDIMIKELKKWGNSQALILPKEWLMHLGVEGIQISVDLQHGRIVLTAPRIKKSKSLSVNTTAILDELIEVVREDYLPSLLSKDIEAAIKAHKKISPAGYKIGPI